MTEKENDGDDQGSPFIQICVEQQEMNTVNEVQKKKIHSALKELVYSSGCTSGNMDGFNTEETSFCSMRHKHGPDDTQ